MKARILATLAAVALSLTTVTAATATTQEAPAPTTSTTSTATTQEAISAASTATLPALDAPTVATTPAAPELPAEPQPQPQPQQETTEPQPLQPEPTQETVDPTIITVDPVAPVWTPEDQEIPSETWNTSGTPLEEWRTLNPEVCTEDMECWDCATMGNKICGASAGQSLDQWLAEQCSASASDPAIIRHCNYLEATYLMPALAYLGSGTTPDMCATYWTPSTKDATVVHSYRDSIPSANQTCNIS